MVVLWITLGVFATVLVVSAVAVWIFMKTQASTDIDAAELTGTHATVVTPIPSGGVGEIAFVARGTRQNAPAHSVDGGEIESRTEVEIVRVVGSSFVVRRVATDKGAVEPEGSRE
jgi:membrane protein implicated in regulation of membrane protease activity